MNTYVVGSSMYLQKDDLDQLAFKNVIFLGGFSMIRVNTFLKGFSFFLSVNINSYHAVYCMYYTPPRISLLACIYK